MPILPTTVAAGDVTIGYDTFGSHLDPPLLLIQGLSAQSLGWHPEFCAALALAGYYVIRHDNRDVGLSQKFPNGGYTLEDMAADSAALLTALDLASAHIVGQSMGGMIAQELALGSPDSVRSLTLIYTTAHLGHANTGTVEERSQVPFPRSRSEAIEAYLENEKLCASTKYPHDQEWLAELGGQMYDRDPEPDGALRQYAAIIASRDRRPLLPAIATPTTILCGDSDALIDFAASEELHELVPNSTLTIYDGMGHMLPKPLWADIVDRIDRNCRVGESHVANPSAGK